MSNDLYFGYGSNLNEDDLRIWCNNHGYGYPFIGKVTDAFLPDMEYIFNVVSPSRGGGVLNLKPRIAQAVHGVVFHVREGGWDTLDAKEGAPGFYKRETVTVFDRFGSPLTVQTYIVPSNRASDTPVGAEPRYLEIVRAGLNAHQLLGEPQLVAAGKSDAVPLLIYHLFVYGTLMSGQRMELRIRPEEGVLSRQPADAPGMLYEVGGLPCLAPSQHHTVHGECIHHSNLGELLLDLDVYEGFHGFHAIESSLYYRSPIFCKTQSGEHLAWAYFATDVESGTIVESGDWRMRGSISH